MQSFYQESDICKDANDRLFKAFRLVVSRVIEEFLEDGIDDSLPDLRACCMQFLPQLLGVGYIDDVVENVVADTLLDDARRGSHSHAVFLDFLLPHCGWVLSGAYLDDVPYVFFGEHGSR